MGLTITEAAKGLGVTRNTLSRFINGRNGISPEMAIRLAEGFGSTPEMWLRLQNEYDLVQARKNLKNVRIKRFVTA